MKHKMTIISGHKGDTKKCSLTTEYPAGEQIVMDRSVFLRYNLINYGKKGSL